MPERRTSRTSLSAKGAASTSGLRKLQKQRGLTDLTQLSHFTIAELLSLKNFGRRTLADLLRSILPMIRDDAAGKIDLANSTHEDISPAVTRAAERLRAHPDSARIRCTDPRFRVEACTLLSIANSSNIDHALGSTASLHDVAHRLIGRTREISPNEHTLDVIGKLRRKIARARRLPLDRELEEISREFARGSNASDVTCLNAALSFALFSSRVIPSKPRGKKIPL